LVPSFRGGPPKPSPYSSFDLPSFSGESRFTESQIVDILKQDEGGVPVAEILRQHNISKATYFQWRAKCAGA